jgi:predicted CoA-binding protein
MSAQPAADQTAAARLDVGQSAAPDRATPNRWTDARTIKKVLGYARTVAIVGLSSNRLRPSFFVGGYLQYRGFRIVPVNPRESEILGERSYASLSEIPFKVDVVDVFRAPEAAPQIAEEAVAIGARALWLQFGVVSPRAAERAAVAGLDVVMDRCMKIEHGRYYGEMHWFGLNTGIVTSRRPDRQRPRE